MRLPLLPLSALSALLLLSTSPAARGSSGVTHPSPPDTTPRHLRIVERIPAPPMRTRPRSLCKRRGRAARPGGADDDDAGADAQLARGKGPALRAPAAQQDEGTSLLKEARSQSTGEREAPSSTHAKRSASSRGGAPRSTRPARASSSPSATTRAPPTTPASASSQPPTALPASALLSAPLPGRALAVHPVGLAVLSVLLGTLLVVRRPPLLLSPSRQAERALITRERTTQVVAYMTYERLLYRRQFRTRRAEGKARRAAAGMELRCRGGEARG